MCGEREHKNEEHTMNVPSLNVSQSDALKMLKEYRQHRGVYNKLDWEIERIARQIARGKTVISAVAAIREAGLDEKGRPRLAICQAHALRCVCSFERGVGVKFGIAQEDQWDKGVGKVTVPWPEINYRSNIVATLPRIPPQYRPNPNAISSYHLLWEASWTDIDTDPYLLRRIGRDAWVVVAAWELTDLEVSVLRAHRRTS
jgi:hypothetical protein